ncbi:hypothetical protein N657DRAFT_634858 [Parathielavia appendiculata]|uniref:Uncharacterized protein n=1 Tax=Parathielavia appendiculata TaxID=2587402 RepID=A0AAN6TY37_9PEZI|nr:hypothetical protein N657DRAFT_634858 [Parathielavia appendiculata]
MPNIILVICNTCCNGLGPHHFELSVDLSSTSSASSLAHSRSLQRLQTQTRVEDCIWVAGTSTKIGVAVNSEVTSSAPGLQGLEQAGGDLYEPGTAAARADARFIDGLDVLDPDFEDNHHAALAAA